MDPLNEVSDLDLKITVQLETPKVESITNENKETKEGNAEVHGFMIPLLLVLKAVPIVIYLIFSLFTSTMNVMIMVVISSAIDFYYVKNIAGRFLLGLYWGSDIEEE